MSNHTPQPDHNYDPAGSTQMFRAFVDEQPPAAEVQRAQTKVRAGVVVGAVIVLLVIVGAIALAMK
ncbi:hypothetical protein VSR01_19065 [Actinacidiphila sp. DG2A-62]|jgi:hypothetical protein|uniref:hypothetical protein n=1 Tax=Actinacidiphila sp. DG2A-62 TaxID=3108821 RepID=UPI002DB9F14E|nr:hypothetical protein [Actinacidiphila sp. DG2A-62]MEC3995515.1 hypothetical protein [Actinacidiphila sp. DG2A-62]